MLLQLGDFQFDTDLGYETLQRISEWRWAEVPISGDYPILQFAGKETPTITFSGTWFNYDAERDRVQSLEDEANKTQPLALTSDDGKFHGFWVITSIRRNEEFFRPKQRSAIKNDWTLTIAFYGNKKVRREGDAPQTSPFSGGSPASGAKVVSAVSQQLLNTSNEIVKSAEKPELAPLKQVREYNRLVSNVKSDVPVLTQIRSDLSDFQQTNLDLPAIPDGSSFFDSFEKFKLILDKGQEYRQHIGRLQVQANLIDALKDNPEYVRFRTSLQTYKQIITDARESQRQIIESVLDFKRFREVTSGVSLANLS